MATTVKSWQARCEDRQGHEVADGRGDRRCVAVYKRRHSTSSSSSSSFCDKQSKKNKKEKAMKGASLSDKMSSELVRLEKDMNNMRAGVNSKGNAKCQW